METHEFEKLIGKDAYVIWDFTCAFFKTKGNGTYLVLGARDDYVQLQKGIADPFWALCSHIDDAYIPVQYKSVPLVTDKSVDTTYIESGKIEPRAFGLNLECDNNKTTVEFNGVEHEVINCPPLVDESPIIQPEAAKQKRKSPSRKKVRKPKDIFLHATDGYNYNINEARKVYESAKEGDTIHFLPPKEKRPRSETRKSRAHLSKPRIKQKDGLFLCHFGVKYVPGIHAIGKGATVEDAYKAWKAANDNMMAIKAARKAQKANGGINGST